MVKQNKKTKEDLEIEAIVKLNKDFMPNNAKIEIINALPNATLVLVDKNELYSLEWDGLRGIHFLLKLSDPNSVRIAA